MVIAATLAPPLPSISQNRQASTCFTGRIRNKRSEVDAWTTWHFFSVVDREWSEGWSSGGNERFRSRSFPTFFLLFQFSKKKGQILSLLIKSNGIFLLKYFLDINIFAGFRENFYFQKNILVEISVCK
jgi:hypothetical protein